MPFADEQVARYRFGYERIRNVMLKRLLTKDFGRADLVVFLSEHARVSVVSQLPHPVKRNVVIPHGIADEYRTRAAPPRPTNFPEGPYLLYVSPLDVYKAQIEVVQGFAKLRHLSPGLPHRLVLAGGTNQPSYERAIRAEIVRLGLQHDVVLAGHVSPGTLPAAYANAAVNIFASEVENCPITLLEAMASGRPLVCSSRAPMPEFAGDAARYFDPSAPNELASALNAIVANASEGMELGRLGAERSGKYTWDATARNTWEAITSV
jgi:glycosyltransferase involved in cell wall biosynthesis